MIHNTMLWLGLWFMTRLFGVVQVWVPNEEDDMVRVVMFANDEFWLGQYKEHLIKGDAE